MVNNSSTNIWVAASDGELAQVKHYIEDLGFSPDSQDAHGYCPLSAAVSYGHYDVAKYLLQKGANPNLLDEDQETPLHHCDDLECAKLLLEAGADPNLRNAEDETPYDSAIDEENEELAEFLKGHTIFTGSEPPLPEDSLAHIECGDDPEPTQPFLSKFESVLKDSTIVEESKRDEQLGELVLDLLKNHCAKSSPQ